jgi:hypothetical protein
MYVYIYIYIYILSNNKSIGIYNTEGGGLRVYRKRGLQDMVTML